MSVSDELKTITRLLEQQQDGPRSVARLVTSQLDRRLGQMEKSLNTHLGQLLSQQLTELLPTHLQALAPAFGDMVLPRFADGGVLSGDTPVALAAEAGPEAVLPLRRRADGQLGVVADMPDNDTIPATRDVHVHIHRADAPDALDTQLAPADLPADMNQMIRQTIATYLAEEDTRP